ncbi:MAG: valine--tRNA ligase, partial [Candidatus Micrarchaeaceae archaeon]
VQKEEYINMFKRLGISVSWDLFYDTISKDVQQISQRSFIELYKMGRAYVKEGPFIYCTKCKTTISQMEMKDVNTKAKFAFIKFGDNITIATTRPELIEACVAVFVNPKDNRYKGMIGKSVKVPILEKEVKVMGDRRVKMENGTGAVMCCTFGDQTDIEWYREYSLPLRIIIDETGTMKDGMFKGMKVKEAREKVIEELKRRNALEKVEEIEHYVNVHERCNTEVEFLVKKQWNIKYLDLKKELKEMGKKVKWHPRYTLKRYLNWIDGIRWDWGISRQRYFGIPFPVWYCKKCGKEKVARIEDLPVNPMRDAPKEPCECGSNEFEPETDVMDTWATSSLTPFINARWGVKGERNILPMDLRPQGYEIISFWAFTTIVKSLLHRKSIPWKHIMISGMGLDPKGAPMHKSVGNVIFPLPYIEKYGADALRYWASGAVLGDDASFQEKDLITASRIINKLWNISKFIEMNLCSKPDFKPKRLVDYWILGELSNYVKLSTKAFENFDYYKARNYATEFMWKFANDYVEFVKYRIYGNEKESIGFLAFVFLQLLKLYAPFMPFVTEEIYLKLFRENKELSALEESESIHVSRWPRASRVDKEKFEKARVVKEIIEYVRKFKHDNKLALNAKIKKIVLSKEIEGIGEIKGSMNIDEHEIGEGEYEIEGIKVKVIA